LAAGFRQCLLDIRIDHTSDTEIVVRSTATTIQPNRGDGKENHENLQKRHIIMIYLILIEYYLLNALCMLITESDCQANNITWRPQYNIDL